MQWVVLGVCLVGLAYGVVNIVSPRTAIAWQAKATARRNPSDLRAHVGTAFQGRMGIDPSLPPSRLALRRIRLLGVVEIVVSVVFIVGAFAIFS